MSSRTQSLQVAAVGGPVIEVALSDDRWEAFVGAHPEGLVYHLPVWLKALGLTGHVKTPAEASLV